VEAEKLSSPFATVASAAVDELGICVVGNLRRARRPLSLDASSSRVYRILGSRILTTRLLLTILQRSWTSRRAAAYKFYCEHKPGLASKGLKNDRVESLDAVTHVYEKYLFGRIEAP